MRKEIKHIPIINSLRGLAALLVCFYHFICGTYITDQTLLKIFDYGNKGVQIFFIISGIVIPLSMIYSSYKIKSFFKFLLVRFIRIEPPYIMAVILGIFYLMIRNFIPSSEKMDLTPTIRDMFLHIGYLIPFVEGAKWVSKVFWTLSIEFQYYIFLALFLPLALNKKHLLKWIFTCCIVLLPFLTTNVVYFPAWSSFFGLGIFYAFYISNIYSQKDSLLAGLFCCLTILYSRGVLDLSIAISTLLIIHFFKDFSFKIGEFFGDISYSLYLLHPLVGLGFINLLSHKIESPFGKFIVVFIALILSVFSALVFRKFIEKPSQNLARKIKLRLNND